LNRYMPILVLVLVLVLVLALALVLVPGRMSHRRNMQTSSTC
jgi:hypothetical protein